MIPPPEYLPDELGDAIRFDGLDDACIGWGRVWGSQSRLVYSAPAIIAILIERDGMPFDEAEEFFDFNIACLYAGDRTPLILYPFEEGVEA